MKYLGSITDPKDLVTKEYVDDVSDMIADEYSDSSTYNVGDYCIYNGDLYRCVTAITVSEAWNDLHWVQVQLGDDVSDLKSDLDVTNNDMNKLVGNIQGYWGSGGLYAATGIEYNSSAHIRTPFIKVKAGDTIIIDNPDINFGVTLFEFAANTTSASGVNEKLDSHTTTAIKTSITLSASTNYIRLQMRTDDTLKGDDVLVYTEDNIVFKSIDNVQNALDEVKEPTRNLWAWGDKSFVTGSGIFDVDLPAGTYTLSADVVRVSTSVSNQHTRIIFYKEGAVSQSTQIANPYLTVNVGRNSTTFTISERAVKATILAVVDNDGSEGIDCAWSDIQIESGSDATDYIPPVTACDFLAREAFTATRNLWVYGNQSFTKVKTIPIDIAAGTYVLSACVTSTKDGGDAVGYRARIEFFNGSTNVLTKTICRNCRGSVRFVLPSSVDSVKIYASNTASNSTGAASTWTNIQLESGGFLTPYISPRWKGTIPAIEKSDELFRMEDVVIRSGETDSYFFIRSFSDERNVLIDIDAKYTGSRNSEYVMPQIRLYYSTSDMGACPFAVGAYGAFAHRQYRLPPFPDFQSGDYINTMFLQFIVPSGLSLTIKKLTVRYSNEMCRPVESGARIDTHGAFVFYPAHTLPAVNAAQRCGATKCIVIPKRSSDGVWFAYHDDTFDLATTILRNADGSAIESSEYAGLPFSQIPWAGFLEDLTVTIRNDYGAFSDVKLMKIEDFYRLCNKTGMKPMFSIHPRLTAAEAQSLYNLTKKHGLVDKLTLKPARTTYMDEIFPVFGNEVESYGLILQRANHTDSDVQDMIDWFDDSDVDRTKVRCFIESWVDLTTTTQIQMILNAGYVASLASYNHTDPSGVTVGAISEADYTYWVDQGVTEFVSSENTSLGLNW